MIRGRLAGEKPEEREKLRLSRLRVKPETSQSGRIAADDEIKVGRN